MSTALDGVLAEASRGTGPEAIALMRLLGEAETEAQARTSLAAAIQSAGIKGDVDGVARLDALQRLWTAHPNAWGIVRSTLAAATHDRAQTAPLDALRHWAEVFDTLASASPEAAVALYSFGDAVLLAEATQDVVDHLQRLRLLEPKGDVLDLGCGIGRLASAIAPHVHTVLGVDIAAGMVEEARRRCGHLGNTRFQQIAGADLAFLADGALDLVLAADVFPYLVQAGGGLAEVLIREIARVLRPGGHLLMLNYSYRGEAEADRRDVESEAIAANLRLLTNGVGELSRWDALTFLLQRGP